MSDIKITDLFQDNYDLFKQFIPEDYKAIYTDDMPKGEYLVGLYDEKMAIGAAVFTVSNGTAEILHLNYRSEVEAGECERALTDLILSMKFDIYRITYVCDMSEYEADIYDLIMLDVGYAPRKGEVTRYSTNLETVYNRQHATIDQFKKRHPMMGMTLGKDLTQDQIDYYNRSYPYARYSGRNRSDELSIFFVEDNIPIAAILIEDKGDYLEFLWMEADDLENVDRMYMIFSVIVNALEKNEEDKKVVICPYLSEVAALMRRFGFTEDDDGHETRIYTYYLS